MIAKHKIAIWNLFLSLSLGACCYLVIIHTTNIPIEKQIVKKAQSISHHHSKRVTWKRGKNPFFATVEETASKTQMTEQPMHKADSWTTIKWSKKNDT